MEKTGLINGVREDVWCQVFEYLDIKDFLKLRIVCSHLKNAADSYTEIYERECLRIFSSDLSLFRYFSYIQPFVLTKSWIINKNK